MSKPQHILIGGLKGSGKSSAALAFPNHTRIAFADPLKDVICAALGITREQLEARKDIEQPFVITGHQLAIINHRLGFRVPAEQVFNVQFPSIRKFMQILGTDIIRKKRPDWHVNKLLARIESGVSYVVDDVRFLDELKSIPGATTLYVMNPKVKPDAHESENSLSAADFGTVVVNDGTVEQLHEKIKQALDSFSDV